MSKYIKWKDLYNALDGAEIRIYDEENAKEIGRVLEDTRQKIINIPTIDIVRCQECKHWEQAGNVIGNCRKHYCIVPSMFNDFCSCGERIANE